MNVGIHCFFPQENPLVALDSKHEFFKALCHNILLLFLKKKILNTLKKVKEIYQDDFFFSSLHRREKITSLIPIYVKANKNSIYLNLILSKR